MTQEEKMDLMRAVVSMGSSRVPAVRVIAVRDAWIRVDVGDSVAMEVNLARNATGRRQSFATRARPA